MEEIIVRTGRNDETDTVEVIPIDLGISHAFTVAAVAVERDADWAEVEVMGEGVFHITHEPWMAAKG